MARAKFMRVSRTVSISVLSALTCGLYPIQIKGYQGVTYTVKVSWSGALPPVDITVAWGDGSTSTARGTTADGSVELTKTYTTLGNFTITASLKDATNSTCQCSGTAAIVAPLAIDVFDVSPKSGVVPFTATFTGSISGGHEPISWTLDFGDGSSPATGSGRSINISHTYTTPGSYTATLTAQDALGAYMGAWIEERPIIAKAPMAPRIGGIRMRVTPIARTTFLSCEKCATKHRPWG